MHTFFRPVLLLLAGFCLAATARAQTDVVLFEQPFDGVSKPVLPAGWEAAGSGWETDDVTPSPGSGGNNLMHKGATAGYVQTPVLDLSSLADGTFGYTARHSSSYAAEHLRVTASTDGGLSFPVELLPAGAALTAAVSTWEAVSVPLPADLLGQSRVVFRFEGAGGTSGTSVLRIDDVRLTGTAPKLEPSAAALGFAGVLLGSVETRTLTLTNAGNLDLGVDAPLVSGPGYSIDPTDAALLAPGASRTYTVRFAPTNAGAAAGTLTFAHTAGASPATIALTGQGVENQNTLGFGARTSGTITGPEPVQVPIRLHFANAEHGLQGLQFQVTAGHAGVRFTGVRRGPVVADEQAWQLFHRVSGNTIRVILLGNEAAALSSGQYDELVALELAGASDGAPGETTATLTLSHVVGALATPGGMDAGLTPGLDQHTLTLRQGEAFFSASAAALDLGLVAVGQAGSRQLTVSNPGGTAPLHVTAAGTNPLFTVTPAAALVAPDQSEVFTVTFAPTAERFGPQTGTIVFTHNAADEVTVVAVDGIGVHGRGDADGDGQVDVVDLVRGIDLVLGESVPTRTELAAVDAYPFPSGDGMLDVRDLTVLSQAILRNAWPDAVPLPARNAGFSDPAKSAGATAAPVRVLIEEKREGLRLHLAHTVPLRAVQFELEMDGLIDAAAVVPDPALAAEASVLIGTRPDRKTLGVLVFRLDGAPLPEGAFSLVSIRQPGLEAGRVRVPYATAVDTNRVRVGVEAATGPETGPGETPRPEAFAADAPYPNPFRAGVDVLRIPVRTPGPGGVSAGVFDAQGRRIADLGGVPAGVDSGVLTWDGRDARGSLVAPGLYLVRIDADGHAGYRRVVVFR